MPQPTQSNDIFNSLNCCDIWWWWWDWSLNGWKIIGNERKVIFWWWSGFNYIKNVLNLLLPSFQFLIPSFSRLSWISVFAHVFFRQWKERENNKLKMLKMLNECGAIESFCVVFVLFSSFSSAEKKYSCLNDSHRLLFHFSEFASKQFFFHFSFHFLSCCV